MGACSLSGTINTATAPSQASGWLPPAGVGSSTLVIKTHSDMFVLYHSTQKGWGDFGWQAVSPGLPRPVRQQELCLCLPLVPQQEQGPRDVPLRKRPYIAMWGRKLAAHVNRHQLIFPFMTFKSVSLCCGGKKRLSKSLSHEKIKIQDTDKKLDSC